MDIAWFRDLVICILGLVVTVVAIIAAVLACLLYNKTRAVLNSLEATSENIHQVSSAVRDEVVKPVVQVASLIGGVSQGISMVSRFFKNE